MSHINILSLVCTQQVKEELMVAWDPVTWCEHIWNAGSTETVCAPMPACARSFLLQLPLAVCVFFEDSEYLSGWGWQGSGMSLVGLHGQASITPQAISWDLRLGCSWCLSASYLGLDEYQARNPPLPGESQPGTSQCFQGWQGALSSLYICPRCFAFQWCATDVLNLQYKRYHLTISRASSCW